MLVNVQRRVDGGVLSSTLFSTFTSKDLLEMSAIVFLVIKSKIEKGDGLHLVTSSQRNYLSTDMRETEHEFIKVPGTCKV